MTKMRELNRFYVTLPYLPPPPACTATWPERAETIIEAGAAPATRAKDA